MALQKVFTYKIVTTQGVFTAGQTLIVYYDTTADGLEVQLDGTVITSGSYLGLDGTDLPQSSRDTESDYYLAQRHNHLHCKGLEGISYEPSPDFPYATEVNTGNSPVCDIEGGGNGEPTNDITIYINSVTYASTSTATDGSFSFNASGTNTPLKFALSDFDYNTEGQTSTTFSNLSQGVYTLYAKDSRGFVTTAVAFIGVISESPTGTYGLKYYYTWKDLENWTGRVQIYQLDYSSSSTELDAGASPFVLNYSQSDKFDPIYYSYASLGIINTKAQGDYYFQDFFTCHDYEFKVVFSLDTGGGYETKWTGFIRAGLYTEPYADLPYNISLEAVDGMAMLKEEEFVQSGGGQYLSRISQLEAIRTCLDKLGYDLNIRVGINIFEDSHDQDLDGNSRPRNSCLEQTYIDPECYITEDGIDSCYDVLMKNLKTYAARIFQYDNKWWIVSQLDTDSSYNYVEYDYEGTYSSNGSYDPVLNWRSASETTRVVSINRDNQLTIVRPQGKINYHYNLYKRDNLLQYGNFNRLINIKTQGNQLLVPILNSPYNNFDFSFTQGIQDMPIISADGQGWTLIKAGEESGVNVSGRIVEGRGSAVLTDGKGASYLLHNSLTINYGQTTPAHTIKVKYVYKIVSADPFSPIPDYTPQLSEPPFVILKFRIKIGGDWLVSGEGKRNSAYDIRVPVTKFNEFETLEFEFGAPSVTGFTDKDIEIRVYSTSAKDDYLFTNLTGLRTSPTTTEPTGFPVIIRDSDNSEFTTNDTLRFYQLEETEDVEVGSGSATSTSANKLVDSGKDFRDFVQLGYIVYNETDSTSAIVTDIDNATTLTLDSDIFTSGEDYFITEGGFNVVKPTDFNATTNPRAWVQKGFVSYDNCKPYNTLIVDEFKFNLLPKGEESKDTQLVTFVNDDRIKTEYDYDLYHADVPIEEVSFIFGDVTIAGLWDNSKAQYRSHFTLSDGTVTETWNHSGDSLSDGIFNILRAYVNKQLKRGRWQIDGSLKYDTEISPANVIYAVTQNNYTYLPLNLSIDYARNQASISMVEINDNVNESDNSAYTTGYTLGYES